MKENYQKKLEKIIEDVKKNTERKKLLLHSCCGPCSTYVLEYLSDILILPYIFIIQMFFRKKNLYYGTRTTTVYQRMERDKKNLLY